ncbi:MAG: hypothetical protein RL325_740 [Planctomycetota bacterium]
MDEHVPDARHYDATYLKNGRPFSLAAQLTAISEVAPSQVLEVGVGTGICVHALRRIGIPVTTLDVQPELRPDIVGDVRAIPAETGAFDVSSCCQVLEHLPFGDFGTAARELARVTRRRLVLSLPDITRSVDLTVTLPLLGMRTLSCSLPVREPSDAWKSERLRTMGHYWEIGACGVRAATVDRLLREAGFARVRSFRVREIPWHRFFVAEAA